MQSLVVAVVVAIIGAGGVAFGAWVTQHWASLERGREREELRKAAALARRDKDLRELSDQLTELVTAATEMVWERVELHPQPLPRSDPRAVRVTVLHQRLKLLQIFVGDAELGTLVSTASRAALTLSNSPVIDPGVAPEMGKHGHANYQAFEAALTRIETLLRATENETAALSSGLQPIRERPGIWAAIRGR